jgi:hypothetical protein
MFIMDLSRPIEPQFKATKGLLPPQQRPSRRLRLNKYPQYVCALDAKAAGASIAKIGSVLYPKLEPEARKAQVKNDLRTAQSLAWNGYQVIVQRVDSA